MIIRPALMTDVDELFFLLTLMQEENSDAPVDVAKAIAHIRGVVDLKGCFVAVKDQCLVGSVGVSPQAPWYSSRIFLGDSWFYVLPSERLSTAAARLKRRAFEFADQAGLDLVFAVVSTRDQDRKSRFFSRGMTPLGGAFIRKKEDA